MSDDELTPPKPLVVTRVTNADGQSDIHIETPQGATVGDLVVAYAAERQVAVDAVTVQMKDGSSVPLDTRIDKPLRGLVASVHGVAGLRALFEIYDGPVHALNLRPEVTTRVKKMIYGNTMLMVPWHASPYPRYISPYLEQNGGVLYVCDVCLRYAPVKEWMEQHKHADGTCELGSHPPGRKVYESKGGDVCLWEVDGGVPSDCVVRAKGIPADHIADPERMRAMSQSELFSQNTGLLARCFLKGKVAFYCSGVFAYYIITEKVDRAHRVRGFFSAEKFNRFNSLSCIMVLPPWQDRGFGRLLIHISYLLCKPTDENELPEKSPERPLSDLGIMAFLSYWKAAVVDGLHQMQFERSWKLPHKRKGGRDVDFLCILTGVRKKDVVKALHVMGLLSAPGKVNSQINWDAAALLKPIVRPELQMMADAWFDPVSTLQPCPTSLLDDPGEPPAKKQRRS